MFRKKKTMLTTIFFCILEQPWCKTEMAFLTQMLFLSIPALGLRLLILLFHSVFAYFTNVLSIGMVKTKYKIMTKLNFVVVSFKILWLTGLHFLQKSKVYIKKCWPQKIADFIWSKFYLHSWRILCSTAFFWSKIWWYSRVQNSIEKCICMV